MKKTQLKEKTKFSGISVDNTLSRSALKKPVFHVQNQVIENIKLGSGEGGSFEGLGEVLICAGFLLIYLIEELVHASCDKYAQHNHCPDDHTQTIKVHRFLFRLREKKSIF